MIFQNGQTIVLEKSGQSAEIQSLLGSGGQGEVYRIKTHNGEKALKWYSQIQATQVQRKRLEFLIDKGSPTTDFLWMEDIAKSDHDTAFGYVMPLCADNVQSLNKVLSGNSDPTFRTLVTAGYRLSTDFYMLHTQGLSYLDISANNVFIDPSNGDIQICDNDNVGVDGDRDAGVCGTPKYMAPEIVRGEAYPTTQTDLHSLAVLLFKILMMNHPFDGLKEAAIKCMDLPALKKVYGTDPVFIFHPTDASNRPHPRYHQNAIIYWPLYPTFLRDLFMRAFTSGLTDPVNGRIREYEWRKAMLRLLDSIIRCPNCRKECFYCPNTLRTHKGAACQCWGCGQLVPCPPRLRVGGTVVILEDGTQFTAHNLKQDFDLFTPIGEVFQTKSGRALRNKSNEPWDVERSTSERKIIAPGEAFRLTSPCKIKFGSVEGEVRL